MNQARLEEWSVMSKNDGPYKAPEQGSTFLYGKVYDHPHHEDGKFVSTSSIIHADGKEVTTRNTKYTLGKASPLYKEWYSETYGKDVDEDNPFSN
jgi:hypothetical protein